MKDDIKVGDKFRFEPDACFLTTSTPPPGTILTVTAYPYPMVNYEPSLCGGKIGVAHYTEFYDLIKCGVLVPVAEEIEKQEKPKFAVGDLVKLKSGGPTMTVYHVKDNGRLNLVYSNDNNDINTIIDMTPDVLVWTVG